MHYARAAARCCVRRLAANATRHRASKATLLATPGAAARRSTSGRKRAARASLSLLHAAQPRQSAASLGGSGLELILSRYRRWQEPSRWRDRERGSAEQQMNGCTARRSGTRQRCAAPAAGANVDVQRLLPDRVSTRTPCRTIAQSSTELRPTPRGADSVRARSCSLAGASALRARMATCSSGGGEVGCRCMRQHSLPCTQFAGLLLDAGADCERAGGRWCHSVTTILRFGYVQQKRALSNQKLMRAVPLARGRRQPSARGPKGRSSPYLQKSQPLATMPTRSNTREAGRDAAREVRPQAPARAEGVAS